MRRRDGWRVNANKHDRCNGRDEEKDGKSDSCNRDMESVGLMVEEMNRTKWNREIQSYCDEKILKRRSVRDFEVNTVSCLSCHVTLDLDPNLELLRCV